MKCKHAPHPGSGQEYVSNGNENFSASLRLSKHTQGPFIFSEYVAPFSFFARKRSLIQQQWVTLIIRERSCIGMRFPTTPRKSPNVVRRNTNHHLAKVHATLLGSEQFWGYDALLMLLEPCMCRQLI